MNFNQISDWLPDFEHFFRFYGFVTWLIITAFSLVSLLNTTWEQRAHLTYLSNGMPLLLCFVFITYTMLPLSLASVGDFCFTTPLVLITTSYFLFQSAFLALIQCFIEIFGRTLCYLLANTRLSAIEDANSTILFHSYDTKNATGNHTDEGDSTISSPTNSMVFARFISALVVVTLGVHIAGIWTGFLMDRAQRQTYIEVRQCIKARIKIERENYNQVSLLYSYHIFYQLYRIKTTSSICLIWDRKVYSNSLLFRYWWNWVTAVGLYLYLSIRIKSKTMPEEVGLIH